MVYPKSVYSSILSTGKRLLPHERLRARWPSRCALGEHAALRRQKDRLFVHTCTVRNALYYGDCYDILREYIADDSIDLIYLHFYMLSRQRARDKRRSNPRLPH